MKVNIHLKIFIINLTIFVIVLNSIGFIGRLIEYQLGIQETTEFVRLFHCAEEGNITAWYSSLSLIFCAILLGFIALAKRSEANSFVKHWNMLSIVFIYLSLDEAARIHEIIILPLRKFFNLSGIFHYSWVIIAIPLLLFFILYFISFLKILPVKTRNYFILSGFVFVSGALGFEMLSGYLLTSEIVRGSIYNSISITIEEFLENIGIVIFIYALLDYIKTHLRVKEILLDIE